MGEASVTLNWPTVTNDELSANDRMLRARRERRERIVGPEAKSGHKMEAETL